MQTPVSWYTYDHSDVLQAIIKQSNLKGIYPNAYNQTAITGESFKVVSNRVSDFEKDFFTQAFSGDGKGLFNPMNVYIFVTSQGIMEQLYQHTYGLTTAEAIYMRQRRKKYDREQRKGFNGQIANCEAQICLVKKNFDARTIRERTTLNPSFVNLGADRIPDDVMEKKYHSHFDD